MVNAFAKLLGDKLVGKDGEVDISTIDGRTIGVYFSAHWCPPCRGFTPKLAKIYTEIKAKHDDFEIIFVSSDQNEEKFNAYHKEMPWLALPFADRKRKKDLSDMFGCRGIPYFVLLNKDGTVLSKEGRSLISKHGANGFPFTTEHLAMLAKKEAELKASIANELASKGVLSTLFGATAPEMKDTATEALVVMLANNGAGTVRHVLPRLQASFKEINKESTRMACLVVAVDDVDLSAAQKEFPSWGFVKSDAVDAEVQQRLKVLLQLGGDVSQEAPHVAVFSGDGTKVLAAGATQAMYDSQASGFPWTAEAAARLKREMEEKAKAITGNLKGLGFLKGAADLIGQGGATVSAAKAAEGADVVGLYFSAHWCGPCRYFTPLLAKCYEECKKQGKKFEVVFLSSDQDDDSFKSYFADMPWLALPYSQRALKELVSKAFEVRGIPTLVLLDPKTGEVITKDGREAVSTGAEFFPWTPERLAAGKRAAAEKAAREKKEAEEAVAAYYKASKESGAPAFLRSDGKECSAALVSFGPESGAVAYRGNFTTVAIPGRALKGDGSVYCEIEVLEFDGIQQMGFATDGFSTEENGSGVGDDAHSFGVDGQRVQKWVCGKDPTSFGAKWKKGDVVQLHLTVKSGKAALRCGLNGKFDAPFGLVCDDIEVGASGVWPAYTASSGKYRFRFSDFKYPAPAAVEAR